MPSTTPKKPAETESARRRRGRPQDQQEAARCHAPGGVQITKADHDQLQQPALQQVSQHPLQSSPQHAAQSATHCSQPQHALAAGAVEPPKAAAAMKREMTKFMVVLVEGGCWKKRMQQSRPGATPGKARASAIPTTHKGQQRRRLGHRRRHGDGLIRAFKDKRCHRHRRCDSRHIRGDLRKVLDQLHRHETCLAVEPAAGRCGLVICGRRAAIVRRDIGRLSRFDAGDLARRHRAGPADGNDEAAEAQQKLSE